MHDVRELAGHTSAMNFAWFTLQIALPVLFWSAYHYHKDRHLPEPPANLLLCFVLGCAAAGISRLLYEGLDLLDLRYDALELGLTNLPALFGYALLAIGPIEELAKLLPFLVIVLRLRAFDEPMDGIVYASFIALGYSTVENTYYLQYLSNFEAVARGFAAPLVHIMFASVWGYYIGRAWLQGKALWPAALLSAAAASTLHGLYDFLVLAEPLAALPLSAALMLLIWVWRILLIRGLHSRDGREAKCGICEVIAGLEEEAGETTAHATGYGHDASARRRR